MYNANFNRRLREKKDGRPRTLLSLFLFCSLSLIELMKDGIHRVFNKGKENLPRDTV